MTRLTVLLCLAFSLILQDCRAQNPSRVGVAALSNREISSAVDRLISSGLRVKLGLVLVDMKSGETVVSVNADQPLKPASVIKILTSVAALKALGPDFRFKTQVFGSGLHDGTVEVLAVKGGGDPELTTEAAWLIVRKLKKLGLASISKIIVDSSQFIGARPSQGHRAYQTGSAALAFNYNSIAFDVCPTRRGRRALVAVDPWEAAVRIEGVVMTSAPGGAGQVVIDENKGKGEHESFPLNYSVAGAIAEGGECTTLYRSIRNPVQYFGRTLLNLLAQNGINAPAEIVEDRVPAEAALLFEHESPPLSHIVEDLNHFSSNFIAEQILFALGAQAQGSWDRGAGIKALQDFVKALGYNEPEFAVADAAGLDHANRLSARIVAALLLNAFRDSAVRPEFENSLSIASRSGTLKKRNFDLAGAMMRAKTGTLFQVSALAGYLYSQSGRIFAFAILQNNIRSREEAQELENAVLSAAAKG